VIGWIGLGLALVVAVVVLGFCAYELRWKAARLRGDVARLRTDVGELQALSVQVRTAQQRLAAARAAHQD
jgi:hypothetical protein